MNPPCLIYEDEHLLVANKPAGLNTHSPSPYSGEGLYEWLRDREPRWACLSIIHRLDKETSGIIVFSKTSLANRSLTDQFTRRLVHKHYVLLTDRPVPHQPLLVKTALVRVGDKYLSHRAAAGAELAETRFTALGYADLRSMAGTLVKAEPLTGRTHQIRVHAADRGFPIMGDTRYGGTPAPRVCLHAEQITLRHPASGKEINFRASVNFAADPRLTLRHALINPESSTAYRLVHGAADGWPGKYLDRLGDYLLCESTGLLSALDKAEVERFARTCSARAVYHKQLSSSPGRGNPRANSPQSMLGTSAADKFTILENRLKFQLSFTEGYSVGLFLDQRDNRRRLLTGHVAAGFPVLASEAKSSGAQVLNAFAYTCGFSVYAAKAGLRTINLDLSKKYLEWGKGNFALNQIDPADHEFIFGDVFDWLRRLQKKDRRFEVILLDPPTFSQSKHFGPFRAEKDYGKLVCAALPLLQARGVLFASCNTANWPAEAFLSAIKKAIQTSHRTVVQEHYCPQPPDFPIARAEPSYLKTIWLRLA